MGWGLIVSAGAGVARLSRYWMSLPENLRAAVKTHKPLERPMPTFPFFYKVVNPDLTAPLAQADGWYITPYDGDSTLL